MRLLACASCHTQYDVSDVVVESFPCRCGQTLRNVLQAPSDARTQRCGSCGAHVTSQDEKCGFCGSGIIQDAGHLSLLCPECYARNPDDSRYCIACGVAFAPETVRVDGHELPCPAGHGLMPTRQVSGLAVNECMSCQGLWVPGECFDALLTRALEASRAADPDGMSRPQPKTPVSSAGLQRVVYRSCPVCDRHMHRHNFRSSSGVIIDSCGEHGTWLDADELARIVCFLTSDRGRMSLAATGGLHPTSSPGEARASEAFARIATKHRVRRGRHQESSVVGSLVDTLMDLLS